MKRRSSAINKSVEDIKSIQTTIKTLKDQINNDFYLTRKSIKYFIALLTLIETDGIQIIKKIYKIDDNDGRRNRAKQSPKSTENMSHLTSTFFRSWDEFKKTQIRLCNAPFIQLAISYLKEHLKACNKIIVNLVNDRNQDIESSNILKYKGKLSKSQMYDSAFLSQFKKDSDAIIEHLQDLKQDINTLHDRAVSEEDGQVDFHVTDEQSYQFAQFYSDLNGTYSIIFKPFQQYDKNEMRSLLLNCLHHIEKCEHCLHPEAKKGAQKYNPWKLDHLERWKKLISYADEEFRKLFESLQSQTSFQFNKYLLILENGNIEEEEEEEEKNEQKIVKEEEIVIDTANSLNEDNEVQIVEEPKRRHHHHHRKPTDYVVENSNTDNDNDNNQKEVIIIEEEEEENDSDQQQNEVDDEQNQENEKEEEEEEIKIIRTFIVEQNHIFDIKPDLYSKVNEDKKNEDDENEIENLKRSNKNLTIRLKKYKDLYEKEKKKNELLEARIRAFDEDEASLIHQRENNSHLLDENMQLKTKIKELENDIYRLKSIMLVNSKDDYMNKRNTNIFVVDDELRKEYERISKENAEKANEIYKLRSTNSKLQMDINISSNISRLKGEKSEIEEKFTLLLQQFKEMEEENLKLTKTAERKKKFKQDFLQSQQINKELNEMLAKKENDLIELKQSIEKYHKMNADLKMSQQKSANIYLNMINPNSNSDDMMSLEQARSKLTRISNEKVKKEEEIRQLKQEIATQESAKDVLNRKIKALQMSEDSLNEKLNNKDAEIQSLNEKLNENAIQLSLINSTKRNMQMIQEENEELTKKISQMNEKMSQMGEKEKSIEILKAKLEEANEKIQKKKQKIAKLKEQINFKDSAINQLKETINNNNFD